jgi:hypothetical protein
MKTGDLVKYNRLARTFCTVTGEPITAKSLGVILEVRGVKSPIIRVHWFQKMKAGWVPFRVLDVL